MSKSIKRHLIIYFAVAALAIATPQFDARVDAEDTGGFFFVLEGRAGIPAGHSTPWAEEVGISGQQILVFTPTDNVFYIDTDQRFSGRLGAGRRVGQLDFGIYYSGLQALGNDELMGTYMARGFLPLLGSLYFPGYSGVYPTTNPAVTASVTYTVLDFEAGFNFKLGQVDVRLLGGLRFADFDQDVFGGTQEIDRFLGFEHRDVDFWGVGPRLGASASLPIGGPFGATASVSGAALFGEQHTRTTSCFYDFSQNLISLQSSQNDFRVAGNFDGELGVTFNHQITNASTMIITLGYRAEAWLDVNNTQSQAPTFSGTIYGTTRADQIFHGPYLRGEWRFD